MRVLLQCRNCQASRVVSCGPGCVPGGSVHEASCPNTDWDAALDCEPGQGCCGQDHHHGQAANACPGAGYVVDVARNITSGAGPGHPGADCPHPSEDGRACVALTPHGEPCPGGHCGLGVEGCTVCRPISVTILDLGVPLAPATGLGG